MERGQIAEAGNMPGASGQWCDGEVIEGSIHHARASR